MIRKKQTAKSRAVSAPVRGWNAKDPLQAMKPEDAVIIDNWFCLPTELRTRKGYSEHVTGITGNVESLFDYDAPDGTEELFAGIDNAGACSIVDVTSSGAVGAASVTGLTSARFEYAHTTNSAGSFIHVVNGVDNLQLYDGTTWYDVTTVSSPYAITGVASNLFTHVTVHQRRLWFAEKNSLSCWYLAVDAISGAATEFNFGAIFTRGGSIASIITWTLDAGAGMDDHLAIISTAGQVAIYTGIDPSSVNTWSLIGVYTVGKPIGTKCAIKYGGDVLLINEDGMIPLSKALISSSINDQMAMSDRIQPQIAKDSVTYGSLFGWQLTLFQQENMLLLNLPISGTASYQYVMNTITGAWSRWTGLPAKCWYVANGSIYFGVSGGVNKGWDTQADNGTDIQTYLLPAFSSEGNLSQNKLWTMARLFMGADNNFAYSVRLNTDFDTNSQPDTPYEEAAANAGALWDAGLWDVGVWGGSVVSFTRWKGVGAVAHYGSLGLRTSSKYADIRFYATDYVYQTGGIL